MDRIIAFDNSMLSNLKRCPRYFFHRHVEHLTPMHATFDMDYKAQFGVAVHEAMDAWFDLENQGDANAMNKAFIDKWMPFEGVDPVELRTLARGLDLLRKYRETYPIENEPFDVKYIEIGFACELEDYIYCGRIDKVVYHKFLKGLVVLDHKTSSSKGYLTIKPNAALDGYIWGCNEVFGTPIIGGMLDQMYLYKTKFDIKRELTSRKPEEIDEWKWEVISWMHLANQYLERGKWPRNTGACRDFAKDCEYKPMCASTCEETIANLKEEVYQHDPWSPYPMEVVKKAEEKK